LLGLWTVAGSAGHPCRETLAGIEQQGEPETRVETAAVASSMKSPLPLLELTLVGSTPS